MNNCLTSLEERLILPDTHWVWRYSAFTTVVAGHAFALYQEDGHMRFCGLTEKDTTYQIKTHKTRAPAVEAWWVRTQGRYQARMFDIVANDEFTAQVILNALPELKL
jgi:hypothetical protein